MDHVCNTLHIYVYLNIPFPHSKTLIHLYMLFLRSQLLIFIFWFNNINNCSSKSYGAGKIQIIILDWKQREIYLYVFLPRVDNNLIYCQVHVCLWDMPPIHFWTYNLQGFFIPCSLHTSPLENSERGDWKILKQGAWEVKLEFMTDRATNRKSNRRTWGVIGKFHFQQVLR